MMRSPPNSRPVAASMAEEAVRVEVVVAAEAVAVGTAPVGRRPFRSSSVRSRPSAPSVPASTT